MAKHLVMPGSGTTVSALGSTCVMKTDGTATAGAYSLVEEESGGCHSSAPPP